MLSILPTVVGVENGAKALLLLFIGGRTAQRVDRHIGERESRAKRPRRLDVVEAILSVCSFVFFPISFSSYLPNAQHNLS